MTLDASIPKERGGMTRADDWNDDDEGAEPENVPGRLKVVVVLWSGERVRGTVREEQFRNPRDGMEIQVRGGGNTKAVLIGPGGFRTVFMVDSFEGTPPTRIWRARKTVSKTAKRWLPELLLVAAMGALALVGLALILSQLSGGNG